MGEWVGFSRVEQGLRQRAGAVGLGLWLGWSVVWAQQAAVEPGPQALVDGLGMRLVRVPAGEFWMGRADDVAALARDYPAYPRERLDALGDETPAHRVRITRDFYLGAHEVTVGQFRRFVQASGYVAESERDGTGGYGYNAAYDPATTARGDAFEGRDVRYSWRNPGFVQGEDEPVVNVTFGDALAMAAWLSAQEGVRYRLPTEAEWEYACRAGATSREAAGETPAGLARVANTFDQDTAGLWPRWQNWALPVHDGYVFTAPVGRFAPNAFGLYDMLGNVWEWTSDRYAEDWYARSPVDDPQGPQDEDAPRVRRGGSWHTWALYARCSFRNINTEASRYPLLGLRLVREVAPGR